MIFDPRFMEISWDFWTWIWDFTHPKAFQNMGRKDEKWKWIRMWVRNPMQ